MLSLGVLLMMSSCGSYEATGAYTGAHFGSIIGSAIGGISGGWRGSNVGSLVGMAGGAVVGAAIGKAADDSVIFCKYAFLPDPGHQIVTMEKGSDVDITGVISENRREEISRHRWRRSDFQFFRIIFDRTFLSKGAADNR